MIKFAAEECEPNAIELDGLDFTYLNAPQTLFDINLNISAGECIVLMGGSGSGKTTITRVINGLAGGYYRGTVSGQVKLAGQLAIQLSSWERSTLVGSVFQDPASQFFSSQLAGEIAFGCENLGYSHGEVVSLADDAIEKLTLGELRGMQIDALSSGQKQRTAIASAIAPRPSILVMDEPSANLDEGSTQELREILYDLKMRGYTLIIAEHRIAYLMDFADRFYYVHHGIIDCELTHTQVLQLSHDERLAMGIRSPQALPRPSLPLPDVEPPADVSPSLSLKDLGLTIGKKSIFKHVNLCVKPGQIVALTGINGAGKTSLAKTIVGFKKHTTGSIRVGGVSFKARKRREHIWYSSNDVSAEFFTARVAEEVLLRVDPSEKNLAHARNVLQQLGLYDLKDHHPASLSGGQKQRLSIACGLVLDRPFIILDEPTSGLDSINMHKLAEALKYAAALGRGIIVITHDNEFMQACCTHHFALT